MKRRGMATRLHGREAVYRCPFCGGVHRVTWNGPHMYKLPCAFDKHGAYRKEMMLARQQTRQAYDPRYVHPDKQLLWYYQEREAQMGVCAAGMSLTGPGAFSVACDIWAGVLVPGWVSAPPPSQREQRAAKDDKFLRPIIQRLGDRHERPLACAYGHRFANWVGADHREQAAGSRELNADLKAYKDLVDTYGAAVGAVVAVLRHHGHDPTKTLRGRAAELADEAGVRVMVAQGVFELERLYHRRRLRKAYQRAQAVKSHRRAAYLAELLELPKREEHRAKAIAMLQELGVEVEG